MALIRFLGKEEKNVASNARVSSCPPPTACLVPGAVWGGGQAATMTACGHGAAWFLFYCRAFYCVGQNKKQGEHL